MRHFRIILIVLMTAIVPAWALGEATVYTDRASFEAAIGPHVTYTFDTDDGFPAAPANMSYFSGFEA